MKIFLINQGELKDIQSKNVFSSGDAYLIDDDKTIYVWLGAKCSVDEKATGAAHARRLDQERNGAAKIITLDQGQETKEFLALVNKLGPMKIVEKNLAKTMLKDVMTGDFAGFTEHKNVLYRISSEEFENTEAIKLNQVPFSKSSLDTEDCFLADLGTKIYIWEGKTCNTKEKVKAGHFAREIESGRAGSQKITHFEEGSDAEFLAAIEKGEDYKESDHVQLRAESDLEEETEADVKAKAVQPELKTKVVETPKPAAKAPEVKKESVKPSERIAQKKEEVWEVSEEKKEKEVQAPKVKSMVSSGAAPGRPGMTDDSIITIEKSETGRRKCPKCGMDNKLKIHESVDKTNIVLDYPRVYGKKYKCGQCGVTWREK